MNEIQRDTKKCRKRPEIHPCFTVHAYNFGPDRLKIHAGITTQKIFRLRIERFAEHLFDEKMPATARCDDPKYNAERHRQGPQPRSKIRVQKSELGRTQKPELIIS
jgi:hypothetical protein